MMALVPYKGGATVYVAEADPKNVQAAVAATDKAAGRYGSKVTYRHGRGELIGDKVGTGSDREQRDRARSIYESNIRQSSVHSSQAVWQSIRDRWGEALAASDLKPNWSLPIGNLSGAAVDAGSINIDEHSMRELGIESVIRSRC
jgi:hypothetical protein